MGMPVVTVAAGGLPVVETAVGGMPIDEATNGFGIAVTKVVGKPGLPVKYGIGAVVDVTAPTITSAATASVNENTVLAFALTANEPVTWAINGGADAARFELSGSTLRWASNGTKDFEAPNDADVNNIYVVQVRATDTAGNGTNQTISVTVLNIVDETAPTITSAASTNNTENTVLAWPLTANETVTWSIVGGADAAKFEIVGSTLRWLANTTKDYETPDDADANRAYVVTIRATDTAGNTTDQTFTATVTDADEVPPTITSGATASVNENATLAFALTANETVTWSIVGGADSARFDISGSTLRWLSNGTKDFEAPNDANTDNVYVVTVRATDTASNITDKTISVTVLDVAVEGGAFATFNGIATNVTLSNGNQTATLNAATTNSGAESAAMNNSSSKLYFEITVGQASSTTLMYGMLEDVGTFATMLSNGNKAFAIYRANGQIYNNNSPFGTALGAVSPGTTLCFAIDFVNLKGWACKSGGLWNGQAVGLQDPANNIGGGVLPPNMAAPAVGFGGSPPVINDAATLNCGQTTFAQTPPAGFVGWPATANSFAFFNGPAPNTTVSNASLTATVTATSAANAGTRVVTYIGRRRGDEPDDDPEPRISTGKYYFECTIGTLNNLQDSLGILFSGHDYANVTWYGNATGVFVMFNKTCNITAPGVATNTGLSLGGTNGVAGDVVGMAVDFDNRKVWCRRNGGLWNGQAAGLQDPVSNVGGVTIPAGTFGPAVSFGTINPGGTTAGNSMTMNFGKSAYANAAPSGFVNWPPA